MNHDRSKHIRLAAMGFGILCALAAIFANSLGLSDNPKLGAAKISLLALAACVFLGGFLKPETKTGRVYYRALLAAASFYAALFVGELGLVFVLSPAPTLGDSVLAARSMQGMYTAAEPMGVGLTANWRGVFDDGILQCNIAINSRGDRDDSPAGPDAAVQRILLIGDSFTFGYCLNQAETIDKQIESLSNGRSDAYNLGVGGYGPGEVFHRFEAADWWTGTDVFYLFFQNDLRQDNSSPGLHTVFDGFVVPRFKPDGSRFSNQEYQQKIDSMAAGTAPSPRKLTFKQLKDALTLLQIRRRTKAMFGSDVGLLQGNRDHYKSAHVDSALDYTKRMRDLAAERGVSFHVVVIPSRGEVSFQRYATPTDSYVRQAKQAELEVVELIGLLSPDCYFHHDTHFNPVGAGVTAQAIIDSLKK